MSDEPIHSNSSNLEFFNKESSESNIPVEANFGNEDINFFNEQSTNNMPAQINQPYGFLQNIWHSGVLDNTVAALSEYNERHIKDLNPLDDRVDPNWSPLDDKNVLDGIDPRHANYVMSATGPKDQLRRKNYALDQMEENRRIENGSTLGRIIGGFTVGGALEPTSWLPIAKTFQYAKMSQTFLQNIPKIAPGMAISSISRQAILQTTKTDGNILDFVVNAYADTVLGTVFMGALASKTTATNAMKAFNAKGTLSLINKGIEPRPILDKEGVLKGWKAVPMDNSVSAQETDVAQVYLDGAMAKNSLYSIPYAGDKIGSLVGKAGQVLGGIISPQVRMTNSRFSTVRGFIDNVADHGFESEGVAQGRPSPDKFELDFNIVRAKNKGLFKIYNGLYLERNGIDINTENFGAHAKANMEGTYKSKMSDKWVTKEAFGKEVQESLITQEPSKHAAVNEAAAMLNKVMDEYYSEYLRLHGISDKILTPRTAKGYLMRSYNVPFLITNEGEKNWINIIASELKNYDAEIDRLMSPIELARAESKQLKAEHDLLLNRPNITDAEVKSSADLLLGSKKNVTQLENNLQNTLRQNEDLHLHVEDLNAVSANESQRIIKLKKPIKKLEKDYEQQKAVVDNLKGQEFFKTEAARKGKTAETAKKNVEKVNQAKEQLKDEEVKLKELKDKLDQARIDLETRLRNGEIDQSLYYKVPNSNQYRLKDEANRLSLRKTHESDFHRQTVAKGYYDSIMNNTSEDLINNIMGSLAHSQNANPTMRRSVLIRDKELYKNNFLHPDPMISVMNYNLALGRKNSFKRMLNRLTVNGEAEELTDRLRKEFEGMKTEIRERYSNDNKKLEKEILKLNKEYKSAQEDMRLSMDKILGKTRYSQNMRNFTSIANMFAVSTKLGFLPFTMSTDLMANVFKHGFWPFVSDGLIPMLKNIGGMLNTKEGQAIRENAAHALIAENHLALTYSDRNWMGAAQDYTPIQGKLMNGFENLAHYSLNFSGANYVTNLMEMTTALIMQSKIMRSMIDHSKGIKLNDKDLKDLLKYGIDPKEWSKRFVDGWESAGGDKNGLGGYMARYWEWKDVEASNQMSKALMRAVRDTVIKRGMFDAPFAMDNPLVNSLFLFKGYVLSSLNRYLVPLLQKPEADKLIGTMFMMATGATQNPLRRIINGQDPLEENDHMFRNAIRDGGVFSILADGYEDLNYLTSGFFQDNVSNERYRNRLEMGVLNGPIGGMANDTTRIIGMVLSGELNQTDIKRMATLVPFAYSWQFRALSNKMIEGLGLPKTRTAARNMKEALQ
jgi:hypothetical protein